jgi:two-component system invasion response regulator UvrY
MSRIIKVLLVDDHAVVRQGYLRLLERDRGIKVVGEAADAMQACQLALEVNPDVAVVDIALPGVSGIEVIGRLLSPQPHLRVLMFSMYDDVIFPARALAAGARGYLSKTSAPEMLVQAIHAVMRGERYLSPDVAEAMKSSPSKQAQSGVQTLTAREFEVLQLLVQGETVKSIGKKLGLSEKTVANHQSVIREKLGARNSMQLARIVARMGLPLSL